MSRRRVLPLLLGVVALLLAGASLPVTRTPARGPGLWNADHDLTLMAVFGTHACQLDAMPVLGIAVVLAAAISLAAAHPAAAPVRLSDPRGARPASSRSSTRQPWFSSRARARPRPTSREWSTNRIHRRNGMRATHSDRDRDVHGADARRGGSAGRGGAAATARSSSRSSSTRSRSGSSAWRPNRRRRLRLLLRVLRVPPESPRRRHPRLRRPPWISRGRGSRFGLYQQRGSGQLLSTWASPATSSATSRQRNVERAGGGTFAGQENRFYPREVELSLFGQIDPYASAVVRFEAGEENARPGDCRHLWRKPTSHSSRSRSAPRRDSARCAVAMAGRTRSTSTICRGSTGPNVHAQLSSAPEGLQGKRASK